MQGRPRNLSDAALAAAGCDGSGIEAKSPAYWSVGYGSHDWAVEDGRDGRWFTPVDGHIRARAADTVWSWDARQGTPEDLSRAQS